ncbi:MAG TPA: transglycosylase family protein [Acidimicrobiales bacterium]
MKRTMAGRIVAVVLFGAPLVLSGLGPSTWAGADPSGNGGAQIGATKQQIAALQGQVSAGASAIHSLALAYDQASLQAEILGQQVASDEAQIAQLREKVSTDENALRKEAILSYTGGTVTSTGNLPAGADPSIRAEYLQVATGDMTDTVDQYRFEQTQLSAAAANLERQELATQAAADKVSAVRAAALREAEAEQAQLTSLQSKLGSLEAARTQGLPVNGGIVTVVRSLVSGGGAGGVWLQLRQCESGDNYQANTGNGFYGAYQFSQSTWSNLGYPGRADLEPPGMQDQAAQKLQSESGWGQWPACSAALGLS